MQLTLRHKPRGVALAAVCTAVLIASMGLLVAQPSSASAAYVSSARWEVGPALWGPRLTIWPTWQGKTQGRYNPGGVMREALRKAGGGVETNSLYNQLLCHLVWASFKVPWHLEPARPDVGYRATVGALCNPGGGGD